MTRRSRRQGESGSYALELALSLPAIFLMLMVVFHALVYARDALLVQGAAREGARAAATTLDDDVVRTAVRDALDGRTASVDVEPRGQPGDLVRVTVTMTSQAGRGGLTISGSAAAAVEPGIRR